MRFTVQRPTLKISTDREPCVRPLGIDVIAVTACWTLINGQFGEVAPTTGRPVPSPLKVPLVLLLILTDRRCSTRPCYM